MFGRVSGAEGPVFGAVGRASWGAWRAPPSGARGTNPRLGTFGGAAGRAAGPDGASPRAGVGRTAGRPAPWGRVRVGAAGRGLGRWTAGAAPLPPPLSPPLPLPWGSAGAAARTRMPTA